MRKKQTRGRKKSIKKENEFSNENEIQTNKELNNGDNEIQMNKESKNIENENIVSIENNNIDHDTKIKSQKSYKRLNSSLGIDSLSDQDLETDLEKRIEKTEVNLLIIPFLHNNNISIH